VSRYKDRWTRIRALNHALFTGVIVGFLVAFSPFFLFASFLGVAIEVVQMISDDKWEPTDSAYDAAEHLVGGLVIGSLFLLRGMFV
jgi:ABC-type Mn2+/Zn2+ transport system permease subunit